MIWLIAVIASMTGFLFGFDEGIVSGVLWIIQKDFDLTAADTGLMMGLLPFGALVAALLTGRFSDWIGRLGVLYLIAIIFSAATLGIIFTDSFFVLCMMRLCLGISVGMSVVVVPLYLAETAPSSIRGRLITCFQLAIGTGVLAAYIINWILAGTLYWRWVFALGLVSCLILFIGLFFLPESPRWLYAHGKKQQARDILLKFSCKECNQSETSRYDEIDANLALMHELALKEKNMNAFGELFSKQFSATIVLGLLLFFFQQLSGINAIIYYAPTIFDSMHMGLETTKLLVTVGLGTVGVIMNFVSLRLVETVGRRPLLIFGFTGAVISLGIIAGMTYFAPGAFLWLLAACLVLFIAAFAVGLASLPYIMASELFPSKARGLGMSLSAASNWGFNVLVVASFPILLENIGISAVFLFYAVASLLGLLYVLRYVPETKGIPLEKIEEYLLSNQPLRELGRERSTQD
jgi:sugar porter (SP) family MFS transporter